MKYRINSFCKITNHSSPSILKNLNSDYAILSVVFGIYLYTKKKPHVFHSHIKDMIGGKDETRDLEEQRIYRVMAVHSYFISTKMVKYQQLGSVRGFGDFFKSLPMRSFTFIVLEVSLVDTEGIPFSFFSYFHKHFNKVVL